MKIRHGITCHAEVGNDDMSLFHLSPPVKVTVYMGLLVMVVFQLVFSTIDTGDVDRRLRLLTTTTYYWALRCSKPRAVWILSDGTVERIDLGLFLHMELQPPPLEQQGYYYESEDDGNNKEERNCTQMYDWQTDFHPTCNGMHETSFSHLESNDLRMVAHGYIRNVFELKALDGSKWALKTRQMRKKFSSYHMQGQIKEAIVADMATSSPNVANIYGACGLSALYEFSNEGSLKDNYKRLNRGERLRTALDVARGLADLHTLGHGDYAPFIHYDIWARQYIKLNGRYQLNDFNTGFMVGWDEDNQCPCKEIHSKHYNPNSAPEEFADKVRNVFDEKVDVYRIGNIFYQLLMNETKYKHVLWRTAEKLILEGHVPELPRDVEKSTDVVVVGLTKAIRMCLVRDPEKRASAKQVADYLEKQVKNLSKESKAENEREWRIPNTKKR